MRCVILSPEEFTDRLSADDAVRRARDRAAANIRAARSATRRQRRESLERLEKANVKHVAAEMARALQFCDRLADDVAATMADRFAQALNAVLRTEAAPAWIDQCINEARRRLGPTEWLQVRTHPRDLPAVSDAIDRLQKRGDAWLVARIDPDLPDGVADFVSPGGRLRMERAVVLSAVETGACRALRAGWRPSRTAIKLAGAAASEPATAPERA